MNMYSYLLIFISFIIYNESILRCDHTIICIWNIVALLLLEDIETFKVDLKTGGISIAKLT